jgi:hypothetical protein
LDPRRYSERDGCNHGERDGRDNSEEGAEQRALNRTSGAKHRYIKKNIMSRREKCRDPIWTERINGERDGRNNSEQDGRNNSERDGCNNSEREGAKQRASQQAPQQGTTTSIQDCRVTQPSRSAKRLVS